MDEFKIKDILLTLDPPVIWFDYLSPRVREMLEKHGTLQEYVPLGFIQFVPFNGGETSGIALYSIGSVLEELFTWAITTRTALEGGGDPDIYLPAYQPQPRRVVVHLLPDNTTRTTAIAVTQDAVLHRNTVLFSLDDLVRLMSDPVAFSDSVIYVYEWHRFGEDARELIRQFNYEVKS